FDPWSSVERDERRPLLVGVIPHTMCNPRVRGCGFCTFPHEPFDRGRALAVTERVRAEIEATVRRRPQLRRRRVDAVYLGGGTANLTPARALASLGEALAETFEVSRAEHTLEGAPVYFAARGGEALAGLRAALGATRLRISMGVQTFDPTRLQAMGRLHLGRREHVQRAIELARRLDATTSADLLINQPGQALPEMLDDVREAVALGLDQICVYHLVLFSGLGTAWSRDGSLLARLPDNERAFGHWAAVREELLAQGYVQRTLTNFERADVPVERQFAYERHSFAPERYDAVGFGPAGISTMSGRLKWTNAERAEDYLSRVDRHGHAVARVFAYDELDQRLLVVTRALPLMEIQGRSYRTRFGTSPWEDFREPLEVLQEAGLLTRTAGEGVALTPRGMFYADSVAGLLAWPRTRLRGRGLPPHAAQVSMMG
ncbi:MAG: hypothetical protein KDK70_11255, partial [Myxococcales bacterium]|nr:hypothetical protein [Myxococcales bacterium]